MLSLSDVLQGTQLLVQVLTGRRRSEVTTVVAGQPRPPLDIRVAATGIVWIATTGILCVWMLGIALILSVGAYSHDPVWAESIADLLGPSFLVPLLALIFAGYTTGKIWKAQPPTTAPASLPPDAERRRLEARLADLETRLNCETIRPEPQREEPRG